MVSFGHPTADPISPAWLFRVFSPDEWVEHGYRGYNVDCCALWYEDAVDGHVFGCLAVVRCCLARSLRSVNVLI